MYPLLKPVTKYLIIAILTVFLCSGPAFAQNNLRPETDPAAMAFDLVLARPLGFGVLIIGGVLFVVSSPFAALGGNIHEAYETLIVTPAEYTFERPLGHFDND